MATVIGWLMLALYIWLPFCFLRNSLKILLKYFRDERRDYDIVSGTIVEIEEQRSHSSRHGTRVRFYAVYRFSYGGKSYRRYGYRLPARLGPGLKPVPGGKMAVGDPVQVRVYRPEGDEKLECRIQEPFYFWKVRLWPNLLVIPMALLFIGYGLYCACLQLTYIL